MGPRSSFLLVDQVSHPRKCSLVDNKSADPILNAKLSKSVRPFCLLVKLNIMQHTISKTQRLQYFKEFCKFPGNRASARIQKGCPTCCIHI